MSQFSSFAYTSAQVDDLVFGESGGIRHARPVSVGLSVVTQSFREAGRLSRRHTAKLEICHKPGGPRLNNPLRLRMPPNQLASAPNFWAVAMRRHAELQSSSPETSAGAGRHADIRYLLVLGK